MSSMSALHVVSRPIPTSSASSVRRARLTLTSTKTPNHASHSPIDCRAEQRTCANPVLLKLRGDGVSIGIVTESTRPAYYAPTRGRYFFTRAAAIRAEAIAIIKRKYPTERGDTDIGDTGWHWSELKRSDVLLRRMFRVVQRASSPNDPR